MGVCQLPNRLKISSLGELIILDTHRLQSVQDGSGVFHIPFKAWSMRLSLMQLEGPQKGNSSLVNVCAGARAHWQISSNPVGTLLSDAHLHG